MKNFDGILRFPATCDELGKKGPFAPSPSLSIDSGAICGFRMTKRLLQESREYFAPNEMTTATATMPSAEIQGLRFASLRWLNHHPASNATANRDIAPCDSSSLV